MGIHHTQLSLQQGLQASLGGTHQTDGYAVPTAVGFDADVH